MIMCGRDLFHSAAVVLLKWVTVKKTSGRWVGSWQFLVRQPNESLVDLTYYYVDLYRLVSSISRCVTGSAIENNTFNIWQCRPIRRGQSRILGGYNSIASCHRHSFSFHVGLNELEKMRGGGAGRPGVVHRTGIFFPQRKTAKRIFYSWH